MSFSFCHIAFLLRIKTDVLAVNNPVVPLPYSVLIKDQNFISASISLPHLVRHIAFLLRIKTDTWMPSITQGMSHIAFLLRIKTLCSSRVSSRFKCHIAFLLRIKTNDVQGCGGWDAPYSVLIKDQNLYSDAYLTAASSSHIAFLLRIKTQEGQPQLF